MRKNNILIKDKTKIVEPNKKQYETYDNVSTNLDEASPGSKTGPRLDKAILDPKKVYPGLDMRINQALK